MNISLAGKKILIIGGARGIGAQIVRDCAASGAVVAWTYFSSSGEKATEELSNSTQAIFAKIYQNANPNGAGPEGGAGAGDDTEFHQ